jgi:NAD(P)-dependent dehydrogenase (short-subunit alcohol dehydrogenase family)
VALPTYPFERQRHWIDPEPASAQRSDIAKWLYAPSWQRSAPVASPTDDALRRERWFLCGAESSLRDAVRTRLKQSGAALTREINDATAVLHFGSDSRSVINIAQMRPASFTLVSRASAFVFGDEVVEPSNAMAMAVARVLSQEHPEIRSRVVDLPRGVDDLRIVDQLLGESLSVDGNTVVAYRGRHRWIPTFTALSTTAANAAAETYLITGGTGRIGRALAKHLCRRGANVAIVSRTPVADPWTFLADGDDHAVSLDLDEIGATDERLLILQADVADPSQMRTAFDAALNQFGSISTVIHAAGVSADRTFQPIEELDDEARARHLAPKAKGVEVLRALVPEFHVRTCVLMSSLSGILGGLGFAAYAGANAYMDLVAQQEDGRHGVRWMSIGWDAWRFDDHGTPASRRLSRERLAPVSGLSPASVEDGGGTPPAQPAGRRRSMRSHAIAARLIDSAIRPAEGIEVLERILASDIRGHVLVSTTDLAARAAQSVTPQISETATRSADVATVVTDTWRQLLGIDAIGHDDDFYDLGGNSLLATQAVSRLRRAFDIELSVRVLFDQTTIAGLTRHIEGLLLQTGARAQ